MAETVYCNSEKRRIHGKGLTEILSAGVSGSFYGVVLKVYGKIAGRTKNCAQLLILCILWDTGI